jgi:hypothetical protein
MPHTYRPSYVSVLLGYKYSHHSLCIFLLPFLLYPFLLQVTSHISFSGILSMVRVNEVRLFLWTTATGGPIVYPPGDIVVCRATVEWYWQGKPKNSRENLS